MSRGDILGLFLQVGVGGVMAAGGYGSFSRKHGLFIDGVLRAKVVLANGTLVTASPKSHPDLLWAIRGGGGGTYGIVTEATVRLFEYPVVTIGALWTRDLADVPKFMDRCVGVWVGGECVCWNMGGGRCDGKERSQQALKSTHKNMTKPLFLCLCTILSGCWPPVSFRQVSEMGTGDNR
jgi:hypothetical protein